MEAINLNLIPNGTNPVVHCSQYDEGREFRFNLFDGASVFVLDGTEDITCDVKKPDGNIVTAAVPNTEDDYIIVTTTLQMTACSGNSLGTINISKGGVNLYTLNFVLYCERSPLENGIESESSIHDLQTQISEGVAEEVATQYDSANVIFDSVPTSGHGNGYAVTSEGVKTEVDNLNTALADKVDTTDFFATNLPISSGDPTNTKDYIDGKIPINKGGLATDLSTTGLTTGTYIYNYDNTTNGIPKANTEGDCYITINNTQAYGCELAVSNSGLYWRNKVNQVWGNWVDIISQLTVDTDISASPVDVNGTYQIPANVLNHNLIVITFRRYGYAATVVATRSGITGGNYGTQFTRASVLGTMYWDTKIDNNGLITLLGKGDTTVPYIEVFGYL